MADDNMSVKNLSEKDEAQLKDLFRQYDKDGDGFITDNEVREFFKGWTHFLPNFFQSLGKTLSEEEVTEQIKEADNDGDGRVSFEEFVQVVKSDKFAAFQTTFSEYDKDGDGYITAAEIQELLGSDKCAQDIKDLVAKADTDGDGKVSFGEFALWLIKMVLAETMTSEPPKAET